MESKLLVSGEILEIPPRFLQMLRAEGNPDLSVLTTERIAEYSEQLRAQPEEYSSAAIATAFRIAKHQIESQAYEEGILYLGVYAEKKARSLATLGRPEEGLGLLVDALQLEHRALALCRPEVTRRLAESLACQTEEALRLCALLGSVGVLAARTGDVSGVLHIAMTIWEPEVTETIQALERILTNLPAVANSKYQRQQARALSSDLADLKKALSKQEARQGKVQRHLVLLRDLTDAWLQMVQQESLLAANAEYAAEGLDLESITRQAQHLIAEVEKRLRLVITKKYKQQFGTGWVQHIEAKHKPMYERWSRYIQRDQTAFKIYSQFSAEVLEYALFEDLRDLAMAQWHLFYTIFDFGFGGRNRSVFHDKMSQIIHVRNLLAHNRAVPENELLRARVLCTDILLALDRAGEGLNE